MKLTAKLILAFLFVSLFSSGVVALFSRAATSLEFQKFISRRYEEELAAQLENYYAQQGGWQGVEKFFERGRFAPSGDRQPPFAVADEQGRIVLAGAGYKAGQNVSPRVLHDSKELEAGERHVGTLLFNAPLERSPMEDEFIRRMGSSIFISALAALGLAFLLGTLLSRAITRPVVELTAATRDVANGNLGRKVTVRSRDEIGELADSFNKMSGDLERSLNLRKQMTADIAHELRTPLSLIIGHAEAVHDGVLPPSAENFEIIREEAERLQKLVNDLRTLSLADAGELSTEFQTMAVGELLRDLRAHYQTPFSVKRVALELQIESAPLKANLDPMRIGQALSNILDNALRHTPEGGRTTIFARRRGNEIEIGVEDSGEGATPEEAARLFERFYRADESRARADGGSGLGLAIAKSIVETHGGKIWAEGEKGKGLKVFIRLPAQT